MLPTKNLLSQKDKELLREFQIKTEVHVHISKLNEDVIVNTNQELKIPLNTSPSVALSYASLKISKDVNNRNGNKKKELFKCGICEYSSASKLHVSQHSWTHLSYKRFKCEKCSYKTNYKNHIRRHLSIKHSNNPESRKRSYSCHLCSKCFFTAQDARTHQSTHTKEKPFTCQFCTRTFSTKGNKNSHEINCIQNPKTNDEEWKASQKRFQCKFCDMKVRSRGNLNIHLRSHLREKPIKCDNCDFATALTHDLKFHMDSRHNPNRLKNFTCKLCLKSYFTKQDLRGHRCKNRNRTPGYLACEHCKKQCLTKSDQNRHQKICQFKLKRCNEETAQKQTVFQCSLCEYSSKKNYYLKRHMLIHTDHKPFQCTFCTFKTKTKENLYRHLRIHTQEKPDKCPHCDFRANRTSVVKLHVKQRHPEMH